VVLSHLADVDLKARVAQTVAVLSVLAADDPWEPARWPIYALLLPHAQSASKHADSKQLVSHAYGRLLGQTATYVRKRGLGYALARDMNERALRIYRQVYKGRDHRGIAVVLTNLAGDLRALGEPARALALDEDALAMDQRMYQGDHPDIGIDLTNLANDLHLLGDHERAREFDEQALAMRQRLYQGDHHEIVESLGNLADDLRELNDSARARELGDEAQAMRQRLTEGTAGAVIQS
jgi:tetratricopeptide (TPR) repeat protein